VATLTQASAFERVTAPDGVSVSVGEWGNPAGPEILLIHGQAQSVLSFKRQTNSALARDFRIVAYDLRGHGASDKPTDAAWYRDGKRWAHELQAVLTAKNLRKPVAVGWSLGGRVLRQYLMHYGDGALQRDQFPEHPAVTHDIAEWKDEMPWMSLYFSAAVWASLALCVCCSLSGYLPLFRIG
jgi:pimeloyl-ACP methyl ester carboxylesterase